MGLDLKDWNGHPLDKGFYEDQREGTLYFIRREGEEYFISSAEEKERPLNGTPGQYFNMLRVDPWEVVERKKAETEKIIAFIKSSSDRGS
jgi:hypothetical protein